MRGVDRPKLVWLDDSVRLVLCRQQEPGRCSCGTRVRV